MVSTLRCLLILLLIMCRLPDNDPTPSSPTTSAFANEAALAQPLPHSLQSRHQRRLAAQLAAAKRLTIRCPALFQPRLHPRARARLPSLSLPTSVSCAATTASLASRRSGTVGLALSAATASARTASVALSAPRTPASPCKADPSPSSSLLTLFRRPADLGAVRSFIAGDLEGLERTNVCDEL